MKVVIFDFDGTIIDTETAWYYIYRDVLKEDYQYNLTLEEFLMIVGTTDEKLFDLIDKSLQYPLDRQLFEERILSEFILHRHKLSLRKGVMQIIERTKDSGIKLAIASSSSREWVEGFLEEFNLNSYFSVVKTKDDVDKVKPDPALYLMVLDELNISAIDALAIEDSVNGSLAAIRAGIQCIVIPNTITRKLEFPKDVSIFDSFNDIEHI